MKNWLLPAAGASLAFLALLLPFGAAFADDVSETFKGATLTIVVGYGAGGNYGQNSQLLSQHLSEAIPGKPNVIVQYMPGAGGLKATNYAFNVMPKTGLAVLMPPEMLVVSQLLQPKTVKYQAEKFSWLGRIVGSNTVLVVRRDSGITTVDSLKDAQIIVASSGTSSQTFLIPSLANAVLGTNLKIVKGYKGAKAMQLSMEQGETQGTALVWMAWTADKPGWFGKPDSFGVPLLQSGFAREKGLPDVPLISELATTAENKEIANFMATASVIGRGLVLPPGVRQPVVAAMRSAFWKTVNSEAFAADARNRHLPVEPLTGEEIQKTVNKTMNIPSEVVERAGKLIFGDGKS